MTDYKLKQLKIYLIISFFLSTLASPSAFAVLDSLALKWQKTILTKGLSPNPNAVLSGANNLIIIGESFSGRNMGFWIIKYDASGRELIKKDYQAEEGLQDFNIQDIVNGDNDNFMVVGNEFANGYKLWIRKFDKAGKEIIKKTYSFPKSIAPGSIIRSDDGSYIITGSEDFKNVIQIKVDSQGNQIWKKTYETESVESIAVSTKMVNKDLLTISVEGELSKFGTGKSNINLTKFDSQGQKIRDMMFPGRIIGKPGAVISDEQKDTFFISYDSSVIPKGNVCVPKNIGENGMYLIKLNSDLATIWNISIGTKMGLIFPPIINRIGDTLILAGRGNLTMEGIEPPWIYLFNLDGHKVGELKLKNHMDFNPNSIVVNENDIFLIGTEMPMGENEDSKVIIFNIGLKKIRKHNL